MLPAALPSLLREHGLKVVEVPGWRNRGRPGTFNPIGVLCHHTATSRKTTDQTVVELLLAGRPDLAGPLSQLGLGRDGTVYVVAAGRANHAGKTRVSGPIPAGDGNTMLVGVEAFNDGVGEPWPEVQYAAYVTLCAVLASRVVHCSAEGVRGHKETSVTGKIDPAGIQMPTFRKDVAARIKTLDVPKPQAPLSQAPDLVDMDRKLMRRRRNATGAADKSRVERLLRSLRYYRRTVK